MSSYQSKQYVSKTLNIFYVNKNCSQNMYNVFIPRHPRMTVVASVYSCLFLTLLEQLLFSPSVETIVDPSVETIVETSRRLMPFPC